MCHFMNIIQYRIIMIILIIRHALMAACGTLTLLSSTSWAALSIVSEAFPFLNRSTKITPHSQLASPKGPAYIRDLLAIIVQRSGNSFIIPEKHNKIVYIQYRKYMYYTLYDKHNTHLTNQYTTLLSKFPSSCIYLSFKYVCTTVHVLYREFLSLGDHTCTEEGFFPQP